MKMWLVRPAMVVLRGRPAAQLPIYAIGADKYSDLAIRLKCITSKKSCNFTIFLEFAFFARAANWLTLICFFFFSCLFHRQAYNETPIYTCHICEKQMKNKRSYQRHFNRHSNTQKFVCTICSKKFIQEKLLKKHESIHNLTTPKSCFECKEEFFDLFKFKAHRRTHHAQNKKQQLYQCKDCNKL